MNLHEISVRCPQLNALAAQPARSIEERGAAREKSIAAVGCHRDGGDGQLLEENLEHFDVNAFLALVGSNGRESNNRTEKEYGLCGAKPAARVDFRQRQ